MAMKSMIKIKAEPACPIKWSATAGGTSPEPASPALIGSMSAVDARPNDVAREKGIERDIDIEGGRKERDIDGERDVEK